MRPLREQRYPSPARKFYRAVLLVVAYFLVLIFLSWFLGTPEPNRFPFDGEPDEGEPTKPLAEPSSNLVA